MRLRKWRTALLSTVALYPVFVPHVFAKITIRGGDWGDIVFEGIKAF